MQGRLPRRGAALAPVIFHARGIVVQGRKYRVRGAGWAANPARPAGAGAILPRGLLGVEIFHPRPSPRSRANPEMVCMRMRVFFEKPIQNNFSENQLRHRNHFWRAGPHFDVGGYVRGEAERRRRKKSAAPPKTPAPHGRFRRGLLGVAQLQLAGVVACPAQGGSVRLAGLPPGLAAGSPLRVSGGIVSGLQRCPRSHGRLERGQATPGTRARGRYTGPVCAVARLH